MSSTNHFKFGASGISSATRGGFKVGVKGVVEYGPTSSTGFWNGVTPPVGGYTIYVNKASQGPSIHVANNDAQCIFKLKAMGATGSTIENVLAWASAQANMTVMSSELTSGDIPIPPGTYTIGQSALGGKIGYILQSGDPGYDVNAQHGLVTTSSDIGYTIFGCQGTAIGGLSAAIGTGQANTNKIIAGCATAGIAARLCNDLVQGGYSDWYLPSLNELNKLWVNRVVLGITPTAYPSQYQSSTELDATFAWTQEFYGPGQNYSAKSDQFRIRAVRSF